MVAARQVVKRVGGGLRPVGDWRRAGPLRSDVGAALSVGIVIAGAVPVRFLAIAGRLHRRHGIARGAVHLL